MCVNKKRLPHFYSATVPFICSVIDDPFLKNFGLRFSIIGTYLLFYIVSVKENTVTMIRFLNGRMNWRSILRQSFTIED